MDQAAHRAYLDAMIAQGGGARERMLADLDELESYYERQLGWASEGYRSEPKSGWPGSAWAGWEVVAEPALTSLCLARDIEFESEQYFSGTYSACRTPSDRPYSAVAAAKAAGEGVRTVGQEGQCRPADQDRYSAPRALRACLAWL